jgi:hypothetical protein
VQCVSRGRIARGKVARFVLIGTGTSANISIRAHRTFTPPSLAVAKMRGVHVFPGRQVGAIAAPRLAICFLARADPFSPRPYPPAQQKASVACDFMRVKSRPRNRGAGGNETRRSHMRLELEFRSYLSHAPGGDSTPPARRFAVPQLAARVASPPVNDLTWAKRTAGAGNGASPMSHASVALAPFPRSLRGTVYVALGRYERAAADYAKVLEPSTKDPYVWFLIASVQLQVPGPEGYPKLCRRMFKEFNRSENGGTSPVWPTLASWSRKPSATRHR